MIVHIYDGTSKIPLEPDAIHDKIWYMKIFTEKEEVELRVSEDNGKLHISVDGQLIIEPNAANSVNILLRGF